MKGYKIQFEIYADSEQEVDSARKAVIGFISSLANRGRAVTANKIVEAANSWESNVFVRNRILDFFRPDRQ